MEESEESIAKRKELVAEINANAAERQLLELTYGRVWDTKEMQRDFEPKAFAAPFLVVVRRSDRRQGTLLFQHYPRFYFGFEEA